MRKNKYDSELDAKLKSFHLQSAGNVLEPRYCDRCKKWHLWSVNEQER